MGNILRFIKKHRQMLIAILMYFIGILIGIYIGLCITGF